MLFEKDNAAARVFQMPFSLKIMSISFCMTDEAAVSDEVSISKKYHQSSLCKPLALNLTSVLMRP